MLEMVLTHKGLPPEAVYLNFRKLLDNIPSAYMVMDRNLHIVYANPAYMQTVERNLSEILGKHIFASFPDTEERMQTVEAKFLETLKGEITRLERQYFLLTRSDGSTSEKCWQCVQTPYYGADGEVAYIIQNAEDITDAEALRKKNLMIAAELDHRVKNLFSVVQAVASLAGQGSRDIDEFREQFSSRLNAMSRTYSALSNTNWDGLLLSDIFEHELEQYGGVGSERIKMTGPEVLLGPKSSQDGSMIIHELATNAAKYGCFSDPNGRLHVSWRVDMSAQTLAVEWSETGLSGITEPTQTGFGTQLTDFMPNIKVERVYRDEGLLVSTVVPLPIPARSALRNI